MDVGKGCRWSESVGVSWDGKTYERSDGGWGVVCES